MAATLRRAGYGVAAISDLFGVAPRTLHAVFRREGIETNRGRRRLTAGQEAEVRALRSEGWTVAAIAERFGIGRDTVYAAIRWAAGMSEE
ncbi:helix-turn-helix domain-containing protein [Microbacterium sp. P05]|uniref:helix-turn-helix domain-containing protein n=1 Tax=Microbacterium sp. P05 TaxID=3366948 RepID=UPI003745F476